MPKQLPNKIIPLGNKDKKFQEKWSDIPNRNMLNFPHSFRMVVFSNPDCGKTTDVKNILIRAEPPFQRLYIVHIDGEYTKEYDDVDGEFLDEIPSPDDSEIFDGEEKTLIILEDLEFKFMNKEQKRRLDRLYGYVSTHKNVSVILLAQDGFNVPPCVRRMSNIYILGKSNDMDSFNMLARKVGMTKDEFKRLYDKHVKTCYDKIWIDLTKDSPFPLRLNGFIAIEKEKNV